MNNDEVITALTGFWYEFVGLDHHKDRDCHWFIETVWSYGEPPTYRVRHDGYVADDIRLNASSYADAQKALIAKLLFLLDREFNPDNVMKAYADEWVSQEWFPRVMELRERYQHVKRLVTSGAKQEQGT